MLVVAALITGCEGPAAPSFDAKIKLPFLRDIFTVNDIEIQDSTLEVVDDTVFAAFFDDQSFIIENYLFLDTLGISYTINLSAPQSAGRNAVILDTILVANSPTSSVINEAGIESGEFSVTFTSDNLPAGSMVSFILLDFFDTQNNPVALNNILVPPDVTVTTSISNTTFRPDPGAFGAQQTKFQLILETPSALESLTAVGLDVDIRTDTLRLSYFDGTLEETEVVLNPIDVDVELPEGLDSITLQRAFFDLSATNAIEMPIVADILVSARRGAVSRSFRILTDIDPAAQSGVPVMTQIRSGPNLNVLNVMNLLPTTITYFPRFLVGDSTSDGFVSKTDFLSYDLKLKTPLIYRFPNDPNLNKILAEPELLDISSSLKERLVDNFGEFMISGTVENNFPSGVTVQFFIDSIATLDEFYDNVQLRAFTFPDEPLFVEPATLDNEGASQTPTIIPFEYLVENTDYRRIFNERFFKVLYSGVIVKIVGTEGDFVRVRPTDFLQMNIDMQFEVTIDEDLFQQ